jgi:hypothetical protein
MKELILDQIYYLDLGSLSPIEVRTISFTKKGVLCEYLSSWQGRIEELDYELFEMNGIKIKK